MKQRNLLPINGLPTGSSKILLVMQFIVKWINNVLYIWGIFPVSHRLIQMWIIIYGSGILDQTHTSGHFEDSIGKSISYTEAYTLEPHLHHCKKRTIGYEANQE